MENNYIITISLEDSDNPWAPYYSGDDKHLSSEIEEFILAEIHGIKVKNIEICYTGKNSFTESELKEATVNSFKYLIRRDIYNDKRNILKTVILYVIGILVGTLYLSLADLHETIAGILSIICWVFIWSGTEAYFFDNLELKRNISKYKRILEAKIIKRR